MSELLSTGIEGLDAILHGGLPEETVTLIQGSAGAGKTTVGLQFLLAGAEKGETCVLISIAQTEKEIRTMAESHGMDIAKVQLEFLEPSGSSQSDSHHLVDTRESDLNDLIEQTLAILERVKPDRLVFDSLLEMRLLSHDDYAHRRDFLRLKRHFVREGITAMVIDHIGEGLDRRIEGVVHGVIALDSYTPQIGTTYRRLMVRKFRGHAFVEGWHDFEIQQGGLDVYPRLLPADLPPEQIGETLATENETLNRMLGGGLERATVTLISGQSGTGKSTLATLFAEAAAKQGMKAGLFLLEERPEVYRDRSEGVGLKVADQEENGMLAFEHFDPAEVSVGQFSQTILDKVEEMDLGLVVIDSLTGFVTSLPERHNLIPQLQALLQQLARQGLVVIVTLSQHGLLGEKPRTDVDVSFLADSVLLLRHSPSGSEIRRTLAVVKKRHSDHERRIKNFVIAPGCVDIEEIEGTAREELEKAP